MTGSKPLAAATLLFTLALSITAMHPRHDRLDMAIADIIEADRRLTDIAAQMPPKGSERAIGR